MSSEGRSARALARRLIGRASEGRGGEEARARAAQAACEFAAFELSLSLGASGFEALLRRAIAQAAIEYPFLAGLHVSRQPERVVDGVSGLLKEHEAAVVAEGLERVLEVMFTSLGRLIGEDLVARLVEREMAFETQREAKRA